MRTSPYGQQRIIRQLQVALKDDLVIPFPQPPRPLELTQPSHKLTIRLKGVDRRPEGIQTEAERGTGRDAAIQSPIQPFLDKLVTVTVAGRPPPRVRRRTGCPNR